MLSPFEAFNQSHKFRSINSSAGGGLVVVIVVVVVVVPAVDSGVLIVVDVVVVVVVEAGPSTQLAFDGGGISSNLQEDKDTV
jgi:hypothetical protein